MTVRWFLLAILLGKFLAASTKPCCCFTCCCACKDPAYTTDIDVAETSIIPESSESSEPAAETRSGLLGNIWESIKGGISGAISGFGQSWSSLQNQTDIPQGNLPNPVHKTTARPLTKPLLQPPGFPLPSPQYFLPGYPQPQYVFMPLPPSNYQYQSSQQWLGSYQSSIQYPSQLQDPPIGQPRQTKPSKPGKTKPGQPKKKQPKANPATSNDPDDYYYAGGISSEYDWKDIKKKNESKKKKDKDEEEEVEDDEEEEDEDDDSTEWHISSEIILD